MLVAFGALWPRTRRYLLIYALLIVVSRVVVTAHYPSDVLAGALVGAVGALLVRRWFAMRRLGFSDRPGRRAAPLSRAVAGGASKRLPAAVLAHKKHRDGRVADGTSDHDDE